MRYGTAMAHPGITDKDMVDLFIDSRICELRETMLNCPEGEMDYEYVAALIRVAWAMGVRDRRDIEDLDMRLAELGWVI